MLLESKTCLNVTTLLFLRLSSRYEGVFDDNLSYFSSKLYVVTTYLIRLIDGHNICFYAELTKIIHN